MKNSKSYINFDGKTIETTVTNKASLVSEWVGEIVTVYSNNPMVVGLDIEWRPNFGHAMSKKTATLQLCIDTKCLIVQLLYIDEVPQELKEFLEDPKFTFVGVEVEDDVLKLRNEYGLGCSKSADVRALAMVRWPGKYRRPGLKDLASDLCGLNMKKPKHVCMSNWEARMLNENQVEYASIDAYASFKLGQKLIIEV